ncbi:ketopantoate reductase family protein [Rickettsiales bacterium]|nr:ketopantoate reductase family protein [Rickettsiales bacterium]
MNILILGCGAIGSYYGFKLQQAGCNVTALIRDNNLKTKYNITISSNKKNYIFSPNMISDISNYKEIPDYILICTKSLINIDHNPIIKKIIKPHTAIVLIQNGIHIENKLAKYFPQNIIIRCLAFICVSKESKNYINHQDYGKIIIGKYPNGNDDKVDKLANFWQSANLECLISDNINQESWKKLIWNAAFNPLSVIANKANTKELLQDKLSHELIKNIMNEIITLANHDNCNLQKDIIDKFIEYTIKMKPYKTSMLLDFENNRPLETRAILGNAIKFAKIKNINTKYINLIYTIIRFY